jgi:hypothetical protein
MILLTTTFNPVAEEPLLQPMTHLDRTEFGWFTSRRSGVGENSDGFDFDSIKWDKHSGGRWVEHLTTV